MRYIELRPKISIGYVNNQLLHLPFMKYTLKLILAVALFLVFGKAQGQQKFEKIIFHSSACFGTCPEISLQIDSTGQMLLHRQFYIGKGKKDSLNSGDFKGQLTKEQFQDVLKTLNKTNYETLRVKEVLCCDMPVRTIIIYCKKKRYYFKSMDYPREADELISFLKQLAITIKLPRYDKQVSLEN